MTMYIILSLALIPVIILAVWAEIKVTSTFKKYSHVFGSKGYTGKDVAELILNNSDAMGTAVDRVSGELTDHYNPTTNRVHLSDSVYSSTSIAALGVAAHECGHAIQHAEEYKLVKLRGLIVKISSITNKMLLPLILIGLILDIFVQTKVGIVAIIFGVSIFGISFIFSLVTLPVEINASKRALTCLVSVGALDEMEVKGAKKVLSAAALTYFAALALDLIQFLRFIAYLAMLKDRD